MRFSWSVENGSRDCPVGSDRQPRAPRNGLRGSRYRPRQRLSALGGNEHKIKPRAQSRDLLCGFDCGHDVGEHGLLYTAQDSSAYWQFEYCVPNWRLSGELSKNSEATPREPRFDRLFADIDADNPPYIGRLDVVRIDQAV